MPTFEGSTWDNTGGSTAASLATEHDHPAGANLLLDLVGVRDEPTTLTSEYGPSSSEEALTSVVGAVRTGSNAVEARIFALADPAATGEHDAALAMSPSRRASRVLLSFAGAGALIDTGTNVADSPGGNELSVTVDTEPGALVVAVVHWSHGSADIDAVSGDGVENGAWGHDDGVNGQSSRHAVGLAWATGSSATITFEWTSDPHGVAVAGASWAPAEDVVEGDLAATETPDTVAIAGAPIVDGALAGWSRRVAVTSQAAQVAAAYPFALVIDLAALSWDSEADEDAFWQGVRADGGDIRITRADGETTLARGVRQWDRDARQGVIYVHHPEISASADATIWLYWGNASAEHPADDDPLGIQGVWGSGEGREQIRLWVTMDAEDVDLGSEEVLDQSGEGNDASAVRGTLTEAAGPYGDGALHGAGDGNLIVIPHHASLAGMSALTLLTWAFPTAAAGSGDARLISKPDNATGDDYHLGTSGSSHSLRFRISTNTGTTTLNPGAAGNVGQNAWGHAAGTWDGSGLTLYLDSSQVATGSRSGTLADRENPLTLFQHESEVDRWFAGRQSGGKIVARALGADEISTIYNNENDPGAFWSLGEVEEIDGVHGTLAATEPPDQAAVAGVPLAAATLAATDPLDIAAVHGAPIATGTLAASEPADVAAITGEPVAIAGQLIATDPGDAAAVTATILVAGQITAAEQPDGAALAGTPILLGGLAATEPVDAALIEAEAVPVTGDLAVTERQDAAALSGTLPLAGELHATDSPDQATVSGSLGIVGALAVSEPADAARLRLRVPVPLRPAAFAQETDEAFLVLLTIEHDDLEEPIRVVDNHQTITSHGESYVGFPFRIELPSQHDDRPPRARLTIDNVSREIAQAIRQIGSAPRVHLRIVPAAFPDIVEVDLPSFHLQGVRWDAGTVSGDLVLEHLEHEPYPAGTFTPGEFPGLVP